MRCTIALLAGLIACHAGASEPRSPRDARTARTHHGAAHAAAHTESIAAPCAGCSLDVPPRHDRVPLLVVMHGDHERASVAADRWRHAAKARGWAVLSLQCPCESESWYKWAGSPDWIRAQVAAVARKVEIDRDRIYLVGWSGGATYIGMNAAAWPSEFAAIVIHGGGQPPGGDACPSHLPAYFLVGDRNPSFPAAVRLRAYLETCGQEVRWDLVEGARHDGEVDALDASKARKILGWLDEHRRKADDRSAALRRPERAQARR
jgi:poly(3-hydroxybutyrate) depolymerase